ncbi:MAG: transposase [Deltaproteobacteria bacterium]|nr:transposase [Deltaproteobacteria bacterium]
MESVQKKLLKADWAESSGGEWALKKLHTLVHMARVPPSEGQWNAFYARLCYLIALYRESKSKVGGFVRRLDEKMEFLFTFLVEEGVEPANNLAERTIRFGVLWRKRSQGSRGDTSGFCRCAIPVSSNVSPPSVSLWSISCSRSTAWISIPEQN